MPRVDSKHSGSQFYQSQFTGGPQYLPDDTSPSPQPSPVSAHQQTSHAPASGQKKKHICTTCDRPFSTSGHLARHSRVHTGERNHKCPFPGCETRCSRQDNLQQHYRIHLSPGSRRSSTRSAIARAMNNSSAAGKRGSTGSASAEPPSSPPPLSAPPALEQARIYSHHSTPPNSPPPLAQATLPATAHLPSTSSSRSSSSPEASYSPINHHNMVSMQTHVSTQNSHHYSYRNGTTTYQEPSQNTGFTYIHTTPLSHNSTNLNHNSFSAYSNSQQHNYSNNHALPHINTSSSITHSQHLHESPNPTPISSRHSISHISHPHSYSQNQSSSAGPASPASVSSHSVSSHTSGPATPSYVYHEDAQAHTYHHGNSMMADHHGLSNAYNNHGQLVQHGYNNHRFDSPPPLLAPIQERYTRRDDRHSASYMHHSATNDYQYHQSMLGHNAWKPESGLRKGLGALVQ